MERQGEGSSLLSDPIPGEKENHRTIWKTSCKCLMLLYSVGSGEDH